MVIFPLAPDQTIAQMWSSGARGGICRTRPNDENIGMACVKKIGLWDWIGLCSVLRFHQHSIGYTGDGFYRSEDPTNSIKVLKENLQKKITHVPLGWVDSAYL